MNITYDEILEIRLTALQAENKSLRQELIEERVLTAILTEQMENQAENRNYVTKTWLEVAMLTGGFWGGIVLLITRQAVIAIVVGLAAFLAATLVGGIVLTGNHYRGCENSDE